MDTASYVSKIHAPNRSIPEFFLKSSSTNTELRERSWDGYILSPSNSAQMLTYNTSSIYLWCLNTGRVLQEKTFHEKHIRRVSWPSPDRVFVSISLQKDICDVLLLLIRENSLEEVMVCVSNVKPLLAVGMGGDLIVTATDVEWRACYSPLPNADSTLSNQVTFSNNSRCFSHKMQSRILKREKKGIVKQRLLQEKIKVLGVHPKADHLAVGVSSGRIDILWSILRSTASAALTVTQFHWHQSAPQSVVFSESGSFLFSGGGEGVLVKLDLTGVRGQSLTSHTASKPSSVGASSANLARYYLPQLGAPIVDIRTFKAECLSKEGLEAAGLLNADPKGLLLCLHLQNQVIVLVSSELKILSRWFQWLQPPPSTGFLSPALSTPLSIAGDALILNGKTGNMQLYDWRKRNTIAQIACCSDQDYVTPHRAEEYSSVEVYHAAMDTDGVYLATVERLHRRTTRRDNKFTADVRYLLGAFRPHRIRFSKWNAEDKSFHHVHCDYNLDTTSRVLDMRFRLDYDQLYLLLDSGSVVIYEMFVENRDCRETWMQTGLYSLAELGIDMEIRKYEAINFACMDFSHLDATVMPHRVSKPSISNVDADMSIDFNMSTTMTSSTVPLLALGLGRAVLCLAIQRKTKFTLQRDTVLYMPIDRNPSLKKGESKLSSCVSRLFWHPRSMHLLVLRKLGEVCLLEWTQQNSTKTENKKYSVLRTIVNPVKLGNTSPIEDVAFMPSSLLLAFVSENGNKVRIHQWKSACAIVPMHEWSSSSPNLPPPSPRVYHPSKQPKNRLPKRQSNVFQSVTFITEGDEDSSDVSVAVVHTHSFTVFSTRAESTDWTAPADAEFAALTRPAVVSRGVKRLQALLESVDDQKRPKLALQHSHLPSVSQGYWPTAKSVWDELQHSSSTNSATHPAVWLKRLLDAELNLYIQSRSGQS